MFFLEFLKVLAMIKVWQRDLPFMFRNNEFGGRILKESEIIIIILYIKQEMDSVFTSSFLFSDYMWSVYSTRMSRASTQLLLVVSHIAY